jgi:hypothetical protein
MPDDLLYHSRSVWVRLLFSVEYAGGKYMSELRGWIIYSWIALPTVM